MSVRAAMRAARKGIVGLFLMPFLPMFLADALLMSHGWDAFHHFVTVPATVVAVGEEKLERQTRLTGSKHASVVQLVRPEITYRFELEGRSHVSSRYFLLESTALADSPGEKGRSGSVTQRMAQYAQPGRVLQVQVAPAEPRVSFVEFGWPGLWRIASFWGGAYLFIAAVIFLFSWLIQVSGQGSKGEKS